MRNWATPITGWEWVDILVGARKQALECDLVALHHDWFCAIYRNYLAYYAYQPNTNDTQGG
jgi:hypothetical protein